MRCTIHQFRYSVLLVFVLFIAFAQDSSAKEGSMPGSEICQISTQTYLKTKAQRKYIIIDVRDVDTFRKYHIPGSVNVRPHTIRIQTHLKDKPLLLINEGRTATGLLTLCRQLRKSGFSSVNVLQGGLLAWKKNVSPLTGDPISQNALYLMQPQELYHEKEGGGHIIVDLTGKMMKPYSDDFPIMITVSPDTGEKALLRKIRRIKSQKNKKNQNPYIIFISNNDRHYVRIQKMKQLTHNETVLFLKGGLAGYQRFLKRKTAMIAKKDLVLQKPRRCE